MALGVIEGDCGSLVVRRDGAKFAALGYVVASNPLDEAYVVPLQDVFVQIKQTLEATELHLPDPGGLLVDLAAHYIASSSSESDDRRMVKEAKNALLSAVREGIIDMETVLQDAAFQGKWGGIEALLEAHTIISDEVTMESPLLEALLRGHKRAIGNVMVTHYNVDETMDLLLHAAKSGLTQLGALLLSNSLENEALTMDDRQATPLHLACENGHLHFVQLLLKHGADIQRTTSDSRRTTALHLAAEKGHCNIIRVLMEQGADTETETAGQTAIHLANQNGHEAAVRLLLELAADNQARADDYQQYHEKYSKSQYKSTNITPLSRRNHDVRWIAYDSDEEENVFDIWFSKQYPTREWRQGRVSILS
jgi:hypothetical protein